MIELKDIVVKFGDFEALHNINVNVKEGEFFTFLGPSGCGKTTTLRTITGFIEPVSGTVSVNNQDITHVPIEKRNIGIVFQSYALFPTMTVYDNIAFGLKLKKLKKQEIDQKVREIARKVDLSDEQLKKAVSQLSGGQQQRVAIARTLAPSPKVLFMDEPLSNLDAKLRQEMRTELKRLHSDTNSTFVYVTHDQLEAMTLSTKVCLMDTGVLQQYAPPLEIYGHPANLFVAEFVGNPTMNFIPATVKSASGNRASLSLLGHDAAFAAKAPLDGIKGDVVLGVRPEFLPIQPDGPLRGKTYSTLPAGMETTVKLTCGGAMLTSVVFGCVDYAVDTELPLNIVGDNIALFDKASGKSVGFGSVTF